MNKILRTSSVDLYVSIYIIGYETQGESIIFTIYSKEPKARLHFIAVIDSYCLEGENITIDMLKYIFDKYPGKQGILDLICWTHPDKDHSLGIDSIITKFSNNKTTISYPSYVMSQQQNTIAKKIAEIIKARSYRKKNENRQKIVPFSEKGDILKSTDIILSDGKKINFLIESVGPYEKIAGAKFGDYKPNELSPLIIIKIDNMNILLGGDAPNMNIEESAQYLPQNVSFVKTPHHCSKSSNYLLKCLNLNKGSLISCTTKFGEKLPVKSIVEEYCNISELVACTSTEIPSKTEFSIKKSRKPLHLTKLDEDKYGVIHYEVNLVESMGMEQQGVQIYPYSLELFGLACELEKM